MLYFYIYGSTLLSLCCTSTWYPILPILSLFGTEKCTDVFLFVKQDLDTEIIIATARGPDATAVSANVVLDERQMNALFLDLVS
jgi:hypothetical protein